MSKESMKLALEALYMMIVPRSFQAQVRKEIYETIEAELAKQEQDEPVGVVGMDASRHHMLYGSQYLGQKPDTKTVMLFKDLEVGTNLYAHPQPRKPLTDEEVVQCQQGSMNWLPKHKCGLHLSHNEHRDFYETVEEFYEADCFVSPEEWNKAVAEDSVWVLRWYPETPIGFHDVAASTLEAIEAKLKEKNT